jgi:hypothetical protein
VAYLVHDGDFKRRRRAADSLEQAVKKRPFVVPHGGRQLASW